MLNARGRMKVWAAIALLFVVSIGLVVDMTPKHRQFLEAMKPKTPEEIRIGGESPFQALIPVALGFREVMASLMWIRADDLFHLGEYGPILALVKRIAFIDPHNLDVYATGAWHMAYNFMDRRLVQDGVEFLEDGTRNNPHVYDLFFELGYMHYDKSKVYPEAVRWYREGRNKPTTTGKSRAPMFVWSSYCHALERTGDVDAALVAWQEDLNLAEQDLKAEPKGFVPKNQVDAARHNLYMMQRRRNEREATWAEWRGERDRALGLWQANVTLAKEFLRVDPGKRAVEENDLRDAEANVGRVQQGRLRRGAPRDVKFDFTWKRISPRRILVEGKIDMPYLGRVTVCLRDVDYDARARRGLDFKMRNATLWLDHMVHVKDGKFKHEIKLDRDPADMERDPWGIFPLRGEKYELFVFFNPRQQSHEIRDMFGWNGEGLADARYLKVDPTRPGRINGESRPLRYVEKRVVLDRKDIV